MSRPLHAAIITQARLGSTRLPRKVMREINHKPLLAYHLDRLKIANLPLIVAIPDSPENDPLEDWLYTKDYTVYRGDEKDVLSRYYEAASSFDLDIIVRVTSDCPLIDGELVAHGVEHYRNQNNPRLYLSNNLIRTYPRGFDYEVFSFELLRQAYEEATEPYDREHVTPYIRETAETINLPCKYHLGSLNLSVDTPEDFSRVASLIQDHKADQGNAEFIMSLVASLGNEVSL
jgi:spore coat polysaccharide biosynthesis protein SpsF